MANDVLLQNDWLADPFFDALGRRFFGGRLPSDADAGLPTDISESADAYVLKINVPGRAKKDIWLNYQDNVLTVGAKATEDSKEDVVLRERKTDRVSRGFRIPTWRRKTSPRRLTRVC
nr:Hsp20 family protein [Lacticaseibacillus kribbianus]